MNRKWHCSYYGHGNVRVVAKFCLLWLIENTEQTATIDTGRSHSTSVHTKRIQISRKINRTSLCYGCYIALKQTCGVSNRIPATEIARVPQPATINRRCLMKVTSKQDDNYIACDGVGASFRSTRTIQPPRHRSRTY